MFFRKAIGQKNHSLLGSSELKRLKAQPRFKQEETNLFGKRFRMADAPTFLSSLDEIFIDEIYKFQSKDECVNIIDCGANIGLATLYFKMNYSKANIVSFEADPNIFDIMKANIASFGYDDIILRNEAVSNVNSFVNFNLEGGHSGMIVNSHSDGKIAQVKAIRLKEVLNGFEKITFLKIDIEGHETDVIPDIAEQLKKVDYLFLEYHSFIDKDQQLDEMLDIIKKAGLRYYLREAYNKPFPFLNREIFLKMDFLTNIFCYRD